MTTKTKNTKKSASKKTAEKAFNVEALTETIKETLSTDIRSNTARAARAILLFAETAQCTKEQIVKAVSEMFKNRLSEVTIRTLYSDAHNSKYALKYVDKVIITDRDTKIASVKS
jgi:hypothetical protein